MTVREFAIIYLEYLQEFDTSFRSHIKEILNNSDEFSDHYLYALCENVYAAMKIDTNVLSIIELLTEYKKDMRDQTIDGFLNI